MIRAFGTVALIVIALLWIDAMWSAPIPVPKAKPCIEEAMREEVRKLILIGLETALERHTGHMFSVRLRHPDIEHPKEALTGMQNGIIAYVNARRAALAWEPPICPK